MIRAGSLARRGVFVMLRRDGRGYQLLEAGFGHCGSGRGYIAGGDDFNDELKGMRQQSSSRKVGLACG